MYPTSFALFNRESSHEESSDDDDDADGVVNEDAIDDGTCVSIVQCFNYKYANCSIMNMTRVM